MTSVEAIQRERGIIGRKRELRRALAVLNSGRHLLLEGPVGVGKTRVALAVCAHLQRGVERVDGDDRYSESKLTGWFDPPVVLKQGYNEESFFAGPLVTAMREGKILFINELNRMPETVQNVLLPALDEHILQVPHIGEVRAVPGFQVVATQNPVEYIATGHLSEALRDRFEHLRLDYQSATEEEAIVSAETRSENLDLIRTAVRLARATRRHPLFRRGASVRAPMSTVMVAEELHKADGLPPGKIDRATLWCAAEAGFTTRVHMRDESNMDFATAFGEVFELVVDRGLDPDDVLPAVAPKV